MGLRSKKELLHKYFLCTQFGLLLIGGGVTMQNKFHQETVKTHSAKDEIPKYPVFDMVMEHFFRSLEKIRNKIYKS